MSVIPILTYRRKIQYYLRSSEHLLAAANSLPRFTEEELLMVGYYAAEIQKTLAVPIAK